VPTRRTMPRRVGASRGSPNCRHRVSAACVAPQRSSPVNTRTLSIGIEPRQFFSKSLRYSPQSRAPLELSLAPAATARSTRPGRASSRAAPKGSSRAGRRYRDHLAVASVIDVVPFSGRSSKGTRRRSPHGAAASPLVAPSPVTLCRHKGAKELSRRVSRSRVVSCSTSQKGVFIPIVPLSLITKRVRDGSSPAPLRSVPRRRWRQTRSIRRRPGSQRAKSSPH
jgi:hypothetical protein